MAEPSIDFVELRQLSVAVVLPDVVLWVEDCVGRDVVITSVVELVEAVVDPEFVVDVVQM